MNKRNNQNKNNYWDSISNHYNNLKIKHFIIKKSNVLRQLYKKFRDIINYKETIKIHQCMKIKTLKKWNKIYFIRICWGSKYKIHNNVIKAARNHYII